MKRILLLVVLTILQVSIIKVKAENKTVVEGRYWNYLIEGMGGTTTSDNYRYVSKGYHFSGLQTFEGITYNVFRDENDKEIAYMREEDNKVYLYIGGEWQKGSVEITSDSYGYLSDNVTEVLIYDFSCQVGKSFPCIGFDDRAGHYGVPFEGKVTADGIISYGDYTYPYQDFMVSYQDNNFIYGPYRNIEGIGNVRGLLPFPQFANTTSGLYWEKEYLMSVTDADGNVIFKNTDLPDHSFLDTNLEWQYYESYGSFRENLFNRLHTYTLEPSDNSKYPFVWKYDNLREIEHDIDTNENFYREQNPDTAEAYLREEDGTVYLSLENYTVPENRVYPYREMKQLYLYDSETGEAQPYTPQPGDEVVLYDFNAKVGDRYRTLIFGCLIIDATVTGVKQEYYENLNPTKPIGEFSASVKVVEILPDIKNIDSYGIDRDECKIKYAEKIGNIYMGNFISLQSELYEHVSNGQFYCYVINNIHEKDGSILFKGRDFQGFSGVTEVCQDRSTDSIIYDLYGHEVKTVLPGSVYICNGKKFIGK